MSFAEVVAGHRVIVCVGSGGVGKTTSAAAIGLWGARQGRRAVVITIDPARRLATSLGVSDVGGLPKVIPWELLRAQGIEGNGSIAAMMLDQKGSWDALVERHAPSGEVRDRILKNPFYQSLSQTFAGSYEYMAVEELARLYDEEGYDLIVVDTPPTKHALDFLEAPRRLQDFLDRNIIRWFVRPYLSATWSGMRLMNRTFSFVFRRLEEATGISALVSISDFFGSMGGMFDGIHERVDRAYRILRGHDCAFVLVTSPEEQILDEAEFLSDKMASLEMPLKGVIFNRTHTECGMPRGLRADPGELSSVDRMQADEREEILRIVREALASQDGETSEADVRALTDNFVRYQTLARGEGLRMEAFSSSLRGDIPSVQVPNFLHDLHDVAALSETHPYLFGGPVG